MKTKLTSRKFWLCLASFIASIGTTIEGLNSSNDTVILAGVLASVVSAGIYTIMEAMVDSSNTTTNKEDVE